MKEKNNDATQSLFDEQSYQKHCIYITRLQQNLILYGYIILFFLGFFGHANTIIIFLRRTLRSVSTSCLFVGVAISDAVYLSVCIYDFLYTGLDLTFLSQPISPLWH